MPESAQATITRRTSRASWPAQCHYTTPGNLEQIVFPSSYSVQMKAEGLEGHAGLDDLAWAGDFGFQSLQRAS
jgi:hypothetical protein